MGLLDPCNIPTQDYNCLTKYSKPLTVKHLTRLSSDTYMRRLWRTLLRRMLFWAHCLVWIPRILPCKPPCSHPCVTCNLRTARTKTRKTQNDWQQLNASADWLQLREPVLQDGWQQQQQCYVWGVLRCAVLCYVVTRPSRANSCKNSGSHKASSECKAIETNLTCQYDSRNFDE